MTACLHGCVYWCADVDLAEAEEGKKRKKKTERHALENKTEREGESEHGVQLRQSAEGE
jgi:hypothetical protein